MKKRNTKNNDANEGYYTDYSGTNNYDTASDIGFKDGLIQSKFNYDLFSDEKASVVEKTIRCKRSIIGSKERWRIMWDDKIVAVLDGQSFSKKEKDFMRTVDGFNFLIGLFKHNSPTLSQLKKALKLHIKK